MERTGIPRSWHGLWHGVHMRAMICSKACVLHVCVAPALHCLDEFGVLAAIWNCLEEMVHVRGTEYI